MENVSEKALVLINQGCALMAQEKYEDAIKHLEDNHRILETYEINRKKRKKP